MKPIDFPESNVLYVAPDGMDDCDGLPACRVPSPLTSAVIVSCWEPSDEERARIAAGGPVWLWVHGGVQPPVSLTTTNPFGNDDSATADV